MLDLTRRWHNPEYDDLDSAVSNSVSDYVSAVIRETDQKQILSNTPGQTKKITNVVRNVIPIAILAIKDKESVVAYEKE